MDPDALTQILQKREHLIGAAVGSGMTAAAAEEGNVDLLLVLSAGTFRLHGASSAAALLPYASANALSWDAAVHHVLPRIQRTPVVLGLCAQDPELDLDARLARIKQYGLAGVTNFPSAGFYDGRFREAVEDAGLGFDREVEMLTRAKAAGLLTVGFCLDPASARLFAQAGVDILCLNLGLSEWRTVDLAEHQAALDRAIESIRTMIDAAKQAVPNPYCVIFGGPVLLPQDTAQVYQRTEALGYIGGSAVERFPTASAVTQTVREFRHVTRAGKRMNRLGALIGTSQAMQPVFETIRSVAASDAAVLLSGESGTGKELAAREIHRLSHLHAKPMVSWNCGAMTESLAMSELFGHERGAFTGATRAHSGKFELADGGTLFMDEVTDLPPAVQASLLRVLQEKEIVRVGGEKTIGVNVRLVAASNKDFKELIPAGRFRLDLYYRLSTVVLRMPPLRERQEDIPYLVWELSQEFSQKYGCAAPRIPDSVMGALARHPWPGNIRELRNVIERVFLLGRGRSFSRAWFEEMFAADKAVGETLAPTVAAPVSLAARRDKLQEALARHKGNKTAAARELGVTRKTIHKWLKQ
ncbi:MAG TPA: phosphoenolpyruvate hydrolase family protein [Planctomycetota bacterium]|nr:phosphoenolpyruvate hydrolase family protein [Planctomycetota bacterium]